MKYSPSAVSIASIGSFVEVQVGPTRVRLTPIEAEEMIRAIELAVERIEHPDPRQRQWVH